MKQYVGLAGLGVFLLAVVFLILRNLDLRKTASGLVSSAGDVATGAVEGVGETVGIPKTDTTTCCDDIRAGNKWKASFSCDAGTWLKFLTGSKTKCDDLGGDSMKKSFTAMRPSGNASNITLPSERGAGPTEMPPQNPQGIAVRNPPPGPTNVSGRITAPSIYRSNEPRAAGDLSYSGSDNSGPPLNNQGSASDQVQPAQPDGFLL